MTNRKFVGIARTFFILVFLIAGIPLLWGMSFEKNYPSYCKQAIAIPCLGIYDND
mgnify:CR=1 FL=1